MSKSSAPRSGDLSVLIPFGAGLVMTTGLCIVFDQLGDWLWEKKVVHSHSIAGFQVHHRYVYLVGPALYLMLVVLRVF